MKFLILFLVLAISAQPLQAGSCDVDKENGQQGTHHVADTENQGHDCCDSDQADPQEGCDSEMDCGFCSAAYSALPHPTRINVIWTPRVSQNVLPGLILPSFSSPPFRPPIS